MKRFMIRQLIAIAMTVFLASSPAFAQRQMEKLDRGVVAIRTDSGIFISWRLFGLDPDGIGFNLYRSANGNAPVKVNGSVLTQGTNFTDTNANVSQENRYFVKPVIDGVEGDASGAFALSANHAIEPCLTVPLTSGNTDRIHFAWVGDLDGDGEYDFVVDRLDTVNSAIKIEAYKRDGTFLWAVDYGTGLNMNNISPGASTIDVGQWDGVTVYDINGDGRAEVITKFADGVTFGDGTTWTHSNSSKQWIGVLDGLTGAMTTYAEVPEDFISVSPMACLLGIGYLDGETPSVVAYMKNRNADKSFNRLICAYHMEGADLTMQWKRAEWRTGSYLPGGHDAHQMRIIDVNEDGFDDVCNIGYALDGRDGSMLYNLDDEGVVHGDRWHIGKFDPDLDGLQGWGVQQDQGEGMTEFCYNASTGQMKWQHFGVIVDGELLDVGRGDVGDLDPRYPGYEGWSFEGIYNLRSNTQITPNFPYPSFRLWWDGDLLSEQFNDGKIEKWHYEWDSAERLESTWGYHAATRSDRAAPLFYGDILGDWREEVVQANVDMTELVIFTTPMSSTNRIYTLAHNPEYRNSMTVHGYMQSHHVDYYLGAETTTIPTPDIQIVGADSVPPAAPTGLSAIADGAQVFLSWDDSADPDVAGYQIFRSRTAGGPYYLLAAGITAPSYTDRPVANGTTYYYTVAAVNGVNAASETSAEVSVVGGPDLVAYYPLDGTAADGSGLENDAVGAGAPVFSSGYSGDAVTLDGADDYLRLPAGIADSDDLTIATWVYWNGGSNWQRIFDFGNGTDSFLFLCPSSGDNTLRFAIKNGGAEQVVQTSALATGQWVHLAVTLSGNTARLYVNGSVAASSSSVSINPSAFRPAANYVGKSQFPDPLFNGQIDDFMVYSYALDSQTISSLAAGADIVPPVAPAGLVANISGADLVLDWADSSESDFAGYTVYRSVTSGSGYSAVASNLTASTYADSAVSAGSTYYYRVTASDSSANESGFSAEVSEDIEVPAVPAGLAAEPGHTLVTLSWDAASRASSYLVKRAAAVDGPYETVGTLSETAFTDSSLVNLTTYYYVISAVNGYGESAHSAVVSATPQLGMLQINGGGPAVSPFDADSYAAGGGSWSTAESIDTSAVADPAPQAVYQTEHNGDFTYTVPGLVPDSPYAVRLHFAEIYHTAAGSRLFDVAINGTQVLDDFDIFAETDARYKATVREFTVAADAGGQIAIQFATVVDNAKVSAIEVLPLDAPARLAYYAMDGDVTDSEGHDGVTAGTPVYAAGHIGQAIDLDGANDVVTLPADLFNTRDLTIATWVCWDGGSDWQRIFDFGNGTGEYLFLTPSSSDGILRFAIKNGGNEQVLETSALTAGQWTHLAVTLNGDIGTLYVNGAAVDSSAAMTINPSDFNPQNNYIAQSQYPDPLFNGKVDEFRVYNAALSATEVAGIALDLDIDIDGLSDAWELAQFGSLDQAGAGDPDSDGRDNAMEEAAGTDPNVSSVPPEIHASIVGQSLSLSWSTNHIGWSLMSSTNLTSGTWRPVRGSYATNLYEGAVSDGPVFYRLEYNE